MIAAVQGPETTLKEFAGRQARRCKPGQRTVRARRAAIADFERFHGREMKLGELSGDLVRKWIDSMRDRRLPHVRIGLYRSSLCHLWVAAFEVGHATNAPGLWASSGLRKSRLELDGAPDLAAVTFGEGMKIEHLVRLFIASLVRRNLSASRIHAASFYLAEFDRSFGTMTVGEFRPGAAVRIAGWLEAHRGWQGNLATVVSFVKSMFAWGSKHGRNCQSFYDDSPVANLERPKHGVRIAFFSAEQEAAILKYGSKEFRIAFRALLATGCRPGELVRLTAEDVDRDAADGQLYWLIRHHKNIKHTGRPRRVYLSEEAEGITREQMEKYPRGPLFRSACNGLRDAPLSETYLNHALRKICRRKACLALGLDDYLPRQRSNGNAWRAYKYVAYAARHTFAVRYLTGFYRDQRGQPIILGYPEVAAYLGNSALMVEKVYGHLVEQKRFLSARLRGLPLDTLAGQ